jgi:peptide/nickel transport system permease protein
VVATQVETRTPRARRGRPIPRGLIVSGSVIAVFVLAALLGPLFVHYEHFHVNLLYRLEPPGSIVNGQISLLGTDQVGRDLAGQILYGSRVSLFVGAATILIAGVFGSALGMLAGYSGSWVDTLIMRIADIQLALPPLVLAILIAGVIGPSVINVVVTLAITRWVLFARVARGSTLSYSTREFVDSARVLGASNRRILLRHILPSIRTPLLVLASVQFGLVILSEASLSFLGLGVPPSVPSWGQTIAGGQDYLGTAWWIATEPGIALAAIAVATAVFGAQLRDYFDPHLRALL